MSVAHSPPKPRKTTSHSDITDALSPQSQCATSSKQQCDTKPRWHLLTSRLSLGCDTAFLTLPFPTKDTLPPRLHRIAWHSFITIRIPQHCALQQGDRRPSFCVFRGRGNSASVAVEATVLYVWRQKRLGQSDGGRRGTCHFLSSCAKVDLTCSWELAVETVEVESFSTNFSRVSQSVLCLVSTTACLNEIISAKFNGRLCLSQHIVKQPSFPQKPKVAS